MVIIVQLFLVILMHVQVPMRTSLILSVVVDDDVFREIIDVTENMQRLGIPVEIF